ncbi:MAG: hypothetical protein F4Z00_08220 [Acidimicrobiaceae bacterium]|nr:hypothetical protein [Acidimicrobiaceae bacterium]MXZ65520.1 hypothetical protein [Acidimicrobiaceae bacterium]MYG79058.1 hypothetical protein [Acidimicrobiaceae bacterium]MYJ84378.1 hypothetical protein [Acidimicrobiaceae bacterium]
MPDVVNADQQFTIIVSELDPTSDRIVEFLAESYGVPINAVFFRHFSDDGRDYPGADMAAGPAARRGQGQSTVARHEAAVERSGLLHRVGPGR